MIHRDLELANIMVGSHGQMLVLDWEAMKTRNEEMVTLRLIVKLHASISWTPHFYDKGLAPCEMSAHEASPGGVESLPPGDAP